MENYWVKVAVQLEIKMMEKILKINIKNESPKSGGLEMHKLKKTET